ncbi:hypothetical protein JRQ81_013539 [Phrynocephalus forsythii]|uniref:DNA excision repair protein ERCC-6-like 2 n=1 Tax=Phrynocephalus forsythii TaxID=171643 RepID=A0A9Q1B449_9SAUR|nr:hypothetical protein JRQ81_013539 [Phrynocephalus forsythii]
MSKTRTVDEVNDVSDESDDIEMSQAGKQEYSKCVKQKLVSNKQLGMVLHRNRLGNADSQSIEEFSSPEDSFSIKKTDVDKQKLKRRTTRCRIKFKSQLPIYHNNPTVTLRKKRNANSCHSSFHMQTIASQGHNVGSLDRLLGDVAEISYIHSNQNVVGSSKAENQMSRWAVQDVFELQQFSQLPANIAVCRAKKGKKNTEESSSKRSAHKVNSVSGISKPSVLYITHPVCQKQKRVHQIGSRTFLLGKTPKIIRRRQFEEIASHFHKNPVEELAKHIVEATSEERQKMLKEFYGAKYPELKELLKVVVPVSVSEGSGKEDVHRPPSRKSKSISKPETSKSGPWTNLCGQKRHDAEGKQFQHDPCIQTDVCHNMEDKQLPTVITQDSISERNSQAFKDFMASDSLSSKSGIIEGLSANTTKGQPNLKGAESPGKPFLSQSESRQSQICKEKSFADLLGDTSILNDLFKSNGNRPTEPPPRRSLSGPARATKTRSKDFWDMLNEQNEESLQKLMDMATIEKLCEKAPLVCLPKEKEDDKKLLWKKNDDFLWKRYNTADTDDESLSDT